MKIIVDGNELFTLTEIQKQVLAWEIPGNILNEDLKRRLKWILQHKYEQTFLAFRTYWEPILTGNLVKSIPTDRDEFARLVFAQPQYKDRMARDKDEQEKLKGNAETKKVNE